MTADLAEACSDLAQWLPVAAALITQHDTTPGPGVRTAPGSQPPWNPETAGLVFTAVGTLADIEAEFRQHVTGTFTLRRRYRDTGAVLKAIPALGEAVGDDEAAAAVRVIESAITAIMQLPAVDLEERPRKVRSACPFCGLGMLRLLPRSGRVTCLRFGVCVDGDGRHPAGELALSGLDGEPRIYWNDGSVT